MDAKQRKELEAKLNLVKESYRDFSKSNEELIQLQEDFRRPGWTTPAEYRFTAAILDSLALHLKAIRELNSALLSAARLVGEPKGMIDRETADFILKAHEKKINMADLVDNPAKVAKELKIDMPKSVEENLSALKSVGNAKSRVSLDDPINKEILDFYNKTVVNGKYLKDWATEPRGVAEKLRIKVSDAAIERIRDSDIKRFVDQSIFTGAGGEVMNGGAVAVAVVVVIVVVLWSGPAYLKERLIVDRSGLIKL